jgi:hypothetical protein
MINFSWRQEYINTKWVICRTVRSKFLLLVPARRKKKVFSEGNNFGRVRSHFNKSVINEKQKGL